MSGRIKWRSRWRNDWHLMALITVMLSVAPLLWQYHLLRVDIWNNVRQHSKTIFYSTAHIIHGLIMLGNGNVGISSNIFFRNLIYDVKWNAPSFHKRCKIKIWQKTGAQLSHENVCLKKFSVINKNAQQSNILRRVFRTLSNS